MTARSAPGPGLAAVPVIEELFALGEFAAALRLSEQVRCSGYLDARLAVLQVVCLDQLGLGDAAARRLAELGGQACPPELLALARDWIGDGRHARKTATDLAAAANRFFPRSSKGSP